MTPSIAPDERVGSSLAPTETNKSKTDGSKASKMIETFTTSRPPVGMFHAFGSVGSGIPSLNDIQKGNFESDGWSGPGQRRNSNAHRDSDHHVLRFHRHKTIKNLPPITEPEKKTTTLEEKKNTDTIGVESLLTPTNGEAPVFTPHDPSVPYENGYQFPPKHTKMQAIRIAAIGFWKFVTTPFGFLLTIYALNIVAWGGMLFLILIRATPAMSHPSWNSWGSGAKKWLEIDSQILNALFNVTGLGLIPWRFRDFYYLLQWRYRKNNDALRKLAGIHRGWFRLQGSQDLPIHWDPKTNELPEGISESALCLPISLSPDPPLTGERAPPTAKYWKLDFVIWAFVWNTLLQIVLNGLMWGLNKYDRPSWSVGLFISLACIVASAGGWVIFKEGKKVKRVEGVPVSEEDQKILAEMREKDRGTGSV
ncbi:hypothetical protein ONS95_003413 [Cadophora gregata]|uniref:uncharacterized protein n=1 Tax=Cadophora gregata TaxID=51156 RepID=UPI0026DAE50B|nr:uncharacterized protein ONS95_003413 [Cadophora gregata]KAK0108618.1 hypothetical protein ONS95_003413 [Cadophora gregata]KAK0108789.1 hypothetical protein ONS96_002634 [Cadophora gregata f. sp. sojae]